MALASPPHGMLELHNLVTACLGTTAILLGLLMMYRAREPGHGWTFPIAAFLSVSGIVDVTHALSLVGTPATGITNPDFFKPSHRLLAELLVLAGLGLGYLRLRKGIVTNSIMTWGWLLVIFALGAVLLMWNLGTAMIDANTVHVLIAGSVHPLLWYYGPTALVAATLLWLYRRFLMFSLFLGIDLLALLCAGHATVVADKWMIIGSTMELTGYLWVFFCLVQSPDDDFHAKVARAQLRVIK